MIKIDDKYIIRSSTDCYVAEYLTGNKPKKDKKGNESPATECLGYFGKIEGALRICRNHALRKKVEVNDYTLAEIVNEIKATNEHFEKALKQAIGDN